MAEDYGVSLKITADTSDLDKIQQKVEQTRKEIAQPVEQTVVEKREQPAPAKVNVEQPEPVTVKVAQDPDPLKIKVELPDPSEIEAAIAKKDFHADVKPQLDPSKLQAIPPIKLPVKAEPPPPVKIEAKADKVRVEVEDAEAKKRIEALTEKEGVKRIRVVTEGGELASRQGGKEIFELEVDAEKAKQTIADLKADARLKVTADTREAMSGFNAMRAASAALHGNFMALGMEISKIGNGIGAMKSIGVGGFFAIGAAITGVVSLAKSLQGLFATLFNVGTVGRDITSIGASLIDIQNTAEQFADAMNDARKASELVNQSLEKEIAALGRVAKAQNEINRQRELSGAKSDKERDAINTKYDSQAIDIGADTARQTEELKRKGIVDEIARLEQEIEQSKKTQADYEAKAAEARSRANIERPTNALTATAEDAVSFFTRQATSEEKSIAASNVATKAQNAADDEAERRAQLEEELEKRRHELKNADLDAEARKAEESAAKAKNAQDAATKASQEDERKAKENAEKDKRQQNAQSDFERQQSRTAADAEFEDRFRAAQRRASATGATEADRNAAENEQVELLRGREAEAKARLEAAQKQLSDELKKPATERDEAAMGRAREDIRAADSTATSARRQREDIEQTAADRRVAAQQDYFGNLARQIEESRPKDRLTAMGLGSGVDAGNNRIAQEQASNVKLIAGICRDLLAATRAINVNPTSTFAD